jgi:hypothetical protein
MTIDDIVNSESSKRQSILPKMAAAFAAGNVGKVVGVADGALITQLEPNIPEDPVPSGGYSILDLELTNTDIGAIYNSGTLNLFRPLAESLLNLPVNSSNPDYTSAADLMADWNISIESFGQVYSGWLHDVIDNGSIDLSNIGGIPDVSYTTWGDSINFPSQNTMALTIQIPLSQLELDGEPGYDPLTDARIELGSTPVNNAFTAHQTGGFPSISTDGINYDVIPEPGSALLLGLGLAAATYGRKIMQAKEAVSKYAQRKQD